MVLNLFDNSWAKSQPVSKKVKRLTDTTVIRVLEFMI
jgi:hypothetical protein